MTTVFEDTKGKIRDKEISARLRNVLQRAAESTGIDVVRVTSGGQDPKGSGGKRTGSPRHDHGEAADLQLIVGKRTLDFEKDDDRPIVSAFVTAAAANGATGVGAGKDYMGTKTLHVGFGAKAIWGAKGKSKNAPKWLRKAVELGWRNPSMAPLSTSARYVVIARDGLHLRQGPKRTFAASKLLPHGTELIVIARTSDDWWQVDLEGDGRADGHVHSAFLRPV